MNSKRKLNDDEARKILQTIEISAFALECLRAKQLAIAKLSEAFEYASINEDGVEPYLLRFGHAARCKLKFFYDAKDGFIEEMLVVYYVGSAYAARSANINSISADLREIAKLVDGGYYSENEEYERLDAEAYEIRFDEIGNAEIYKPMQKEDSK